MHHKQYGNLAQVTKRIVYDIKHGVEKQEVLDFLELVKADESYSELRKANDFGYRMDTLEIPLLGDGTEMEAVIPLYAEEVVISKMVVKVAELVIRKRKVTQTRKIDIGRIVEELTIQNPTGRTPSGIENEE